MEYNLNASTKELISDYDDPNLTPEAQSKIAPVSVLNTRHGSLSKLAEERQVSLEKQRKGQLIKEEYEPLPGP